MKDFHFKPPTQRELDAIARSSGVKREMEQRAAQGAAHAKSIAPVDTGEFRSRFRVESAGDEVRLVNDDPGAAAIEFGTSDTPAHRTLARTADYIEGG